MSSARIKKLSKKENQRGSLSEEDSSDEKESLNVSASAYTTDSDDLGLDISGLDISSDVESDDEQDEKITATPKKYKKRLIVGDGDCSFSAALIQKHLKKRPGLAAAVTVSDLAEKESLKDTYPDTFEKYTKKLQKKGATLLFGVDATELDKNNALGKHYSRIHFNFPHDGRDFRMQSLPNILRKFFNSASKLQKEGDQVLMALPKIEGQGNKNDFYKGYVYDIYSAAAECGYRMLKKRSFGPERYPGYSHVITGRNDNASVAGNAREYIFEKTTLTEIQIYRADRKEGRYRIGTFYGSTRKCLQELPTDSDSSSYEESMVKKM